MTDLSGSVNCISKKITISKRLLQLVIHENNVLILENSCSQNPRISHEIREFQLHNPEILVFEIRLGIVFCREKSVY